MLLCLLLTGCGSTAQDTMTGKILKIGKADCTILAAADAAVMIDCGEADDTQEILDTLKAMHVQKLDLLILTHFDKDHVGGAAEILRTIPVAQVVESDYTPENPNSDAYTAYRAALAEVGTEVIAVKDTLECAAGTMHFTIQGPGEQVYSKNTDNNHSLVITVTHAGNRLLFAGDIEKQRIRDILNTLQPCNFLKVPHHGVYNSALPELFSTVSPTYAVITDSKKNPADAETLEALDAAGAQTFETVNGTVSVVSTQNGLEVSGG